MGEVPLHAFLMFCCRVGCRVQGAWCRVQGAGCRVPGAGCKAQGARRITRRILKLRNVQFGKVLDLRTSSSQKREAVPRRARIQSP